MRKKSVYEIIQEYSKDFNGSLEDNEVIELAGCAEGYYYEVKARMQDDDPIWELFLEACLAAEIDPESLIT